MRTLSASDVPITGSKYHPRIGHAVGVDWEVPQAMTQTDIQMVKTEYIDAAKAAIDVGFDGVEIHGANGYALLFNSAGYIFIPDTDTSPTSFYTAT